MDPAAQNSIYTILDRHAREVRFLTFMPTVVPDAVELQLHVFNIDTAPPYRALSYVWGDRTITDPIRLNDVNVQVTKNLHAALQAIRRHYTGDSVSSELGYIWIDAICINQEDDTEKTHQVGLMHDIYSQATEVLMWLGEEDEDSGVAISLIKQWSTALKLALVSDLRNNTPAFGRQLANSIFHFAGTSPLDAHLDDDMDRSMSLCSFFERPYWERMWIVQEIILAQCGLVLCGTDTLPLEDLWLAMMALRGVAMHGDHISLRERSNMEFVIPRHLDIKLRYEKARLRKFLQWNTPSSVPLTSLGSVTIRLHLPTGPASSNGMNLWDLLEATESFKSTDPRDRIYSLLGLLDAKSNSIKPNYSLEVSKVYTEIILSEIRASGSLSALTFAGTGLSTTRERIPGLPSWALDFTTRWKTHPPCSDFTAGGITLRNTTPSNTTPSDTSPNRSAELRSTGIICDEIRSITSISSEDRWDVYSVICEFVKFIRNNVRDLDLSHIQPLCIPWIQVLFRNIICDSINTEEAAERYPRRIMPMLFSFGAHMVSLIERSELGGDKVASVLLSPKNYERLEPVLRDSHVSLDEKRPAIRRIVFDELLGPDGDSSLGNTTGSSQVTPINESMDEGDLGISDCLLGLFRAKSRFIISNGGFMGFVTMGTRERDSLCILSGCPMPLVVRPNGDKFELVGKAYVYGMMQGETVRRLEGFNEQRNLGRNVAEKPDFREICLV